MNVQQLPLHTMKWNPFLTFNGQCQDAFEFYARCFGGEIVTLVTWGNSPMADQAPAGFTGKILHATLQVGGNLVSGYDAPPAQYESPRGFNIQFNLDDPAEAERIFHALAEDGSVEMPLQATFWAVAYGHVIDRFGVPWAINCERTR
jgi:PhnB protein